MTELLTSKTAILYGAGGDLGGAVARTFAREGATVYLAGRTREPLARVAAGLAAAGGRAPAPPAERREGGAADVAAAGGRAPVAVVDALDERAVDEHADAVAAEAGGIDASFNLISRGDVQGRPIIDLGLDELLRATTAGVTSLFLTARAAARHMAPRGSGVVLHLTSGSSRGAAPMMCSTGPADGATDALARYLAAELGPSGIRVLGIHTAAVRETLTAEKIAAVSGAQVD